MASVHTILYRLKYVTVVVHTLMVLAYLVRSCLLRELSIHKIHPIRVKAYIIMYLKVTTIKYGTTVTCIQNLHISDKADKSSYSQLL